jgi:hypothetical protein
LRKAADDPTPGKRLRWQYQDDPSTISERQVTTRCSARDIYVAASWFSNIRQQDLSREVRLVNHHRATARFLSAQANKA